MDISPVADTVRNTAPDIHRPRATTRRPLKAVTRRRKVAIHRRHRAVTHHRNKVVILSSFLVAAVSAIALGVFF